MNPLLQPCPVPWAISPSADGLTVQHWSGDEPRCIVVFGGGRLMDDGLVDSRRIELTFDQGVFVRIHPKADDVAIEGFGFEVLGRFEGPWQGYLPWRTQQWRSTGTCPDSGVYVAAMSPWRDSLPKKFHSLQHYVLVGRESYVEVLAQGFSWKEWLWTSGERDTLVDPMHIVGQGTFSPSERQVHTSPKPGYHLVISTVERGPHGGNHSRGEVFGQDGVLIASIHRNFGSFPFLFVEDHPQGDFLVCGEDYQGQTVIELRSGQRRDQLSEGAEQGWGFCWAQASYHAKEQVLVVDGCHWACPYEFRFFDFSDPMNGWPEITCERCIDTDSRTPEFHPDGTITTFQSSADGESPAATLTFRREGLTLRLVEEWISEAEQQARAASEQARIDYDRWLAEFKASDPLFLAMKQLLQDPMFRPDPSCSVGRTYSGWCADFPEEEYRLCQRIHCREGEHGYTLDLEWGVHTGPVKLVVFLDGKQVETPFWMIHAVESIEAAFAYARTLLASPSTTREAAR